MSRINTELCDVHDSNLSLSISTEFCYLDFEQIYRSASLFCEKIFYENKQSRKEKEKKDSYLF